VCAACQIKNLLNYNFHSRFFLPPKQRRFAAKPGAAAAVRAESASCVYRVSICKLINCNFRSRFSCYLSEDDDLRQNLERRQLCAQKAPRVYRVSICKLVKLQFPFPFFPATKAKTICGKTWSSGSCAR
jgi:hypothetical protein